jgi:hypothetical protein
MEGTILAKRLTPGQSYSEQVGGLAHFIPRPMAATVCCAAGSNALKVPPMVQCCYKSP